MVNKSAKKGWLIAGAVVVILGLWFIGGYNSLVTADIAVENSWADVQVQYQRRVDLVPQLVATVKGAANFEQETLTAVTEARTRWLDAQSQGAVGSPEQIAAANNFDSAFARLLVTVEAYPNIKATENFQTLQAQLEGTENRVAVARRDYNQVVTPYNTKIRRFPTSLIAAIFNFEKYEFFEGQEGSENAPVVNFEQ